jgi:hypothetical protein
MIVPFNGPAYEAKSLPWSAQRCVNWYLEKGEESTKTPSALMPRPGLTAKVTLLAASEVRGLWAASDGNLYAVAGSNVYKVTSGFIATQIGSLTTSSGKAGVRDNGNQLIVVDGAAGYTYNFTTATWATITDAGFPNGASQVEYQDSYFIAAEEGSQRFWISGAGNGNAWDTQDTASAEGRPDNLLAVVSNYRELWLFGERTAEVWFNTGNATFPFERSQNAFIEVGCAAKHSVAKLDNTVYWFGRDDRGSRIVWRANGYIPVRVSNNAIESAFDSYAIVDDAFAFAYSQAGHTFYVLTFPTQSVTWVYDAATSQWHERAYFNTALGTFSRWQPNCHAYFADQHIVGDYANGKLYALDLDNRTDDGNTIRWLRRTQTLASENRRQFFNSLEIDLEPGVGLATGQGSDPRLMLRWSDDGGRTWSNELQTSAGAIGDTGARARFHRTGSGRSRVWEISATDPVKWVIYGAYANADMGAH